MSATTNAGVQIKVSVLGQMQLDRALQGRIRATSDLRPAFERIADDFFEGEEKAFAREGAYEGNPKWQPLSTVYAEYKARKYPGARILTASGKLQEAMTGGSGAIRDVDRLRLAVGGSVTVGNWDLGSLHQTGTRRMPARKVVNLSRRQRHRWVRIITDHLRVEGRVA